MPGAEGEAGAYLLDAPAGNAAEQGERLGAEQVGQHKLSALHFLGDTKRVGALQAGGEEAAALVAME